jgi:hypothetical protein
MQFLYQISCLGIMIYLLLNAVVNTFCLGYVVFCSIKIVTSEVIYFSSVTNTKILSRNLQ